MPDDVGLHPDPEDPPPQLCTTTPSPGPSRKKAWAGTERCLQEVPGHQQLPQVWQELAEPSMKFQAMNNYCRKCLPPPEDTGCGQANTDHPVSVLHCSVPITTSGMAGTSRTLHEVPGHKQLLQVMTPPTRRHWMWTG